jgi:hypothetical protein
MGTKKNYAPLLELFLTRQKPTDIREFTARVVTGVTSRGASNLERDALADAEVVCADPASSLL